MHIRRGDRDISKRGDLEFPDVPRVFRRRVEPGVLSRIGEQSRQVVETGIVKLHARYRIARGRSFARQRETAVTGRATHLGAVKNRLAPACRFRESGLVPLEAITIVWRSRG